MAKKIDITDKLTMEGNPSLVISGKELEVNADAATMLVLMDKFGDGDTQTVKSVLEMYDIIFPEETRNAIADMELSFADLKVIIAEGMKLITGDEEETPGEEGTPATT